MRLNANKFDGLVVVGQVRSKGVWVAETRIIGSKILRAGGRLNTSASAHTLLTVALICGLRNISKNQAQELAQNTASLKPRLQVKSIDPTFLPSLSNLMVGQKDQTKPLRTIKSLYRELARQIARFDLVFDTEAENNGVLSLMNWAVSMVVDPIDLDGESPVLVPSVVGSMGSQTVTGEGLNF